MGNVSATIDDADIRRVDEMVEAAAKANPEQKMSRARMIGQLLRSGLDMTTASADYADLRQIGILTEECARLATENETFRQRVADIERQATVTDDRYARLDIQYREVAAKLDTATARLAEKDERIAEMTARFGEQSERIADLKADKVKLNADKDLLASTIIPLLEAPREVYQPPQVKQGFIAKWFGGTKT